MKTIVLTALLLLVCVPPLHAFGRFSLGPELGMNYQTHLTPNGKNLSGALGFTFGLSGTYEFFGDLRKLAIDYSVGYTLLPKLTYNNVTLGGITGTYREDLDVFHWFVGARYHFFSRKWRPFAGMAVGLQFFNRRNVELKSRVTGLQSRPLHSNHLNFALVPQFGIEYRPTFRWAFGIGMKFPLSIRSVGVVPAVQIPFTVHFAF